MSRFLVALALSLALPVAAQTYRPAFETQANPIGRGAETVLVYFGASDCAPCHAPPFKAALERAKVMLAERAAAEGRAFAAVGVAMDWDVARGFAFLQEAGAFDEVVIGRNWENAAALTHLWRPDGIETRAVAMPSVLVFERTVMAGDVITASPPVYRFEAAGAPAVMAWIEAGAPLD
jgi:thiol-disulfide isomerase/thioredoxin